MKEQMRCTVCGLLFPATGNETVWLSGDGRFVPLNKYVCDECRHPRQSTDAADTDELLTVGAWDRGGEEKPRLLPPSVSAIIVWLRSGLGFGS
jgi:rubredoxin